MTLSRETLSKIVELDCKYANWLSTQISVAEEEHDAALMTSVPMSEVLPLVSATLASLGTLAETMIDEDLPEVAANIIRVAQFGKAVFKNATMAILHDEEGGLRYEKAFEFAEESKELGVDLNFTFDGDD